MGLDRGAETDQGHGATIKDQATRAEPETSVEPAEQATRANLETTKGEQKTISAEQMGLKTPRD